MKHKHFESMKEYLLDAESSETPWEYWEYRLPGRYEWVQLAGIPTWEKEVEYRRRLPMVEVTVSVPSPVTHELEDWVVWFNINPASMLKQL